MVEVLCSGCQRKIALGNVKQARQPLLKTMAVGRDSELNSIETKGRKIVKHHDELVEKYWRH